MKFSAKLEGLLTGLSPVMSVSQTGAKSEYRDALKTSINVTKDAIIAESHNGNVAARNIVSKQADLDYQFSDAGKVTVLTKNLSSVLQSFDPSETLTFELKGGELEIRPESDAEKFQTIPTETDEIEMPVLAIKFTKNVSIAKGVLSKAINKVIWAIGTEQLRPEFFYWALRFRKNTVRAVAGDGGRFAIYEITGTDIMNCQGDIDIIVYKDQNAALSKALELSDVARVEVREFVKTPKDTTPDQIVVESDSLTLILVGHDSGANWPNEDKYVSRPSSYKFVTSAESWTKEFAGVMATVTKEVTDTGDVHTTAMTFDSKKKVLSLKVDGPMKANRKIPIMASQIDAGLADTIEIGVETANLKDMVKCADGAFQIELLDSKKPLVVRYYADQTPQTGPLYRVNQAADTKEQFIVFFAAYNLKS